MTDILHITTHMGGGVGRVLSSVATGAAADSYRHKIIMLETPQKTGFIDDCKKNNIECYVIKSLAELTSEINKADIVELEWWHNPVMSELLAKFPKVAARLIIWSHISGCYYPHINFNFLQIPQKFMFTSSYSLDNPYWKVAEREWAVKNCPVVNSVGNMEKIEIDRFSHKDFIIGYVGTQAYSKLNPDIVKYMAKAAALIPTAKFVFVGDNSNKEKILNEAADYNIADKISFSGYVENVNAKLAAMDVFSYILNPLHFGTTENVILEAMNVGLPVICLNQCTEKYIIASGTTGFLVNDIDEYAARIKYLYDNQATRLEIGRNAQKLVREKFSLANTIKSLNSIYDEVMAKPKQAFSFELLGSNPKEWFLRGLPPSLIAAFTGDEIDFGSLPHILREASKSSLKHFARCYPADSYLAALAAKLEKWEIENGSK